MAKVIAFKVVVEGVERAIINERELAKAVKEVAKAYRSADFGSTERAEAEKQLKRLQQVQGDLNKAYFAEAKAAKDAAKQAEKAAKDRAKVEADAAKEAAQAAQQRARAQQRADHIAAESIKGLKTELQLVQDEYENLSKEERQAAGKPLLDRIAQLKTELGLYRQEVRDTAREQTISADKGEGSYRALNAELVNLRREYKELGRAERDVVGPDMLKRIDKLDRELKDLDADMGQYQRNVGNYASAMDGLSGALIDVAGVDLAALASPQAALAAAGAAAGAAAQLVKSASSEYRELRGEISLLTKTAGEELDDITTRSMALAETFKENPKEIALAAQVASKQLKISYGDALDFIEEGFLAGSNAQGQFLDIVKEYPTFFEEAGLSAEQFFQVANLQATEGIYGDKLVDAVKEASLSLRELTDTQVDALAAIGISQEDIRRQIEEEGVGAAIATVSKEMTKFGKDSMEVGQVIADVFKGAGEDAGYDALILLQDLGTATGNLVDESNAYVQQQRLSLRVNKDFAEATRDITEAMGQQGLTFEDVTTQGKTMLFQVLTPFVKVATEIGDAITYINDKVQGAGQSVNNFFRRLLGMQEVIRETGEAVDNAGQFGGGAFGGAGAGGTYKGVTGELLNLNRAYGEGQGLMANYAKEQAKAREEQERTISTIAELEERIKDLTEKRQGQVIGSKQFNDTTAELTKLQKQLERYRLGTKRAGVETEKFARDSIGFLQAELSDLQDKLKGAVGGSAGERSILEDIIGVEQAIEKLEEGRTAIRNEISRMGDNLTPLNILPETSTQLEQLSLTNNAIEEQELAFRERLNEQIEFNAEQSAKRRAQNEIEAEQIKAQRIADIQNGIYDTFSAINSALSSGARNRADRELAAVRERYEGEIALAEGNTQRQEELREEQAERERAIRQQEFEQQKKLRTAMALASLASGIVNILSSPSVLPIGGPQETAKAIQIGFLTATTAVQIAEIQSQQLADRGVVVEPADEEPAPSRVHPRTARRRRARQHYRVLQGWVRGQSHQGPDRGVPLTLNGRQVLVEDGEWIDYDEHGNVVVINKRSAARERDTLESFYGKTFPGKRAALSQINELNLFGRPLMEDGGMLPPPSMTGLAMLNAQHNGTYAQIFGPQPEPGKTELSDEAVARIAAAAAEAIYQAGREGVADGAADANRRREREERLNKRTGN